MSDDLNAPNYDDFEKSLVQVVESTSRTYYINLDYDILSPHYYRKAFEALENANAGDTAVFRINTYGGYMDTVTQFYQSLLKTPATTIAEINYVCSAGSFIALCCDEIIITELSTMMFHSVSFSEYGKMHEIKSSVDHDSDLTDLFFDIVCKGFLSENEIKKIKKGEDLWLTSEGIAKRANKRKLIR